MGTRRTLAVLAGVLVILSAICVAGAIVYYTVPAHSLPSFIPGSAHANFHHPKRGLVLAVASGVFLIGAVVAGVASSRHRTHHARW